MPLFSRQSGEGSPLVLLHGLFGSLENLGVLARPLSEHFCVHAVDLPNHGRSMHTASLSLSVLAETLAEWMDQQGLEKAHFVGHSLGGKAAMEFALRWPERVDSLSVLDIAPVPYSAHHDAVFKALHALDVTAVKTRQDADQQMQAYLEDASLRSFLLKNLQKDKEGKFHWRINLSVIARDYANILEGNRAGIYSGPVLFLKGETSPYILKEHQQAIHSCFPHAQFRIISGTGHWLHAEKPELVSKSLLKFLLP